MTENVNGSEELDHESLRKSAIKECTEWIDRITPHLEALFDEQERLNNAIMCVHESRLTWLERLAGVLDIDVRRGVFAKKMGLFWADVDGNILMDSDPDFPLPSHEITSAADLLKLTTTKEAAVALAMGEEGAEEGVQ